MACGPRASEGQLSLQRVVWCQQEVDGPRQSGAAGGPRKHCGRGDTVVPETPLCTRRSCLLSFSRKCHSLGLVVALCKPVLKAPTRPLETSHVEARRRKFLFLSLSRLLVFFFNSLSI